MKENAMIETDLGYTETPVSMVDSISVGVRAEFASGPKIEEESADELLKLLETVAVSGYEMTGLRIKTLPEGITRGKVTIIVQSPEGRLKYPDRIYASAILQEPQYRGMRIHYADPSTVDPVIWPGTDTTEAAAEVVMKVIRENLPISG